MRIFIGTIEIASHYGLIARELQRMGYTVSVYGPLLYKRDPKDLNVLLIPKIIERASLLSHQKLPKLLAFISRKCLLTVLFFWVCMKSDVVILYGGSSFVSFPFDLFVFRRLGKKLIVNCAHGSESRPPYLNSKYNFDVLDAHKRTKKLKKNIRQIEKFSDHIICLPVLSQFFERRLIHRDAIGKPIRVGSEVSSSETEEEASHVSGVVQICHIPSDPVSKGSDAIRDAVGALSEFGVPENRFRYSEVTGIRRDEVLDVLRKNDIIITQMFSDIPTPTTALEAAAVGCVPVVGGSGSVLERFTLRSPVSLFIQPNMLAEVLARLVSKPELLIRLSRRYRRNIEKDWRVVDAAKNYEKLFFEGVPTEWCFEPTEYAYVWGDGLSVPLMERRLTEYYRNFGVRGFHVENNPALESELVRIGSGVT